MERLLLIFIVIGNAISFLYALPYQEINFEDASNSKKNYSIIVLLEDELENSKESVPKKSGRTIHETAWSKESKDSEQNSVMKETDHTDSTKSTNSWDISHLLKSILNLVHNEEEEETGKVVKRSKDNRESKNKSKKSKFHKPTSEAPKTGHSVQKKQSYSNFESNSQTNYPFPQPSAQKKLSRSSSKDENTAKPAKSSYIDTFSSTKVNNEAFVDNQHLIEESTIQESESNELIDDNYYYDDNDYDKDKYCDYYSLSNSSEKDTIPTLTPKETAEDSYEMGGVEVSDEDYLKLNSVTTEELASDEDKNEFFDEITLSRKMSTNAEKDEKDENISIQNQNENILQQSTSTFTEKTLDKNELASKEEEYSSAIHQTTDYNYGIEKTTVEDDNELDYSSISRNNQLNIMQKESQNAITLTTKDDKNALQEPEATQVTNSYRPLMKTTALKEVTEQSFISEQAHMQSTTPTIPDVADHSTKTVEFQSEVQDQLMQENMPQETSSDILSTKSDSTSKQSSLNENFLAAKNTDSSEIRKHVKMNSEFQAQNNSMNNQETNQELLVSLPLSSSGEYISNTSEKDQQLSNTFEKDQKISNTSNNDQQLLNTSENNQQLLNTSEKDKQLRNTSETNQQLSNTSGKDLQLSNTSVNDQQLSTSSENNKQLSSISESKRQLSNTFENDEKIILSETDSKSTNLEFSNFRNEFVETGQKKNQLKNPSLSHTSITEKQEQDNDASQIVNNADFNTDQEIIILNKADENSNLNQNGDSLLVNEVTKRFSGTSVMNDKSSKHIEENGNEEDYYEFDVGTSVKSVSKNNQVTKSVKTSSETKESDENNTIQSSVPIKPYNTILEFLYKNSNSSLIQSLKEY